MLDKITGKDEKDVPDLRKNGNKSNSNMGNRLRNIAGKITGEKKEEKEKKSKTSDERKKPRPMPRPRRKPTSQPSLTPGPKKKPTRFGRQINQEDQRTLIGAVVFGIIILLIVVGGYYFLVYSPYQQTLNAAKTTKINEVNTYFKGPLAVDPRKQALMAEIDGATTPESVLAVDVLGPATGAWREYQTQQIKAQKDNYGRVMIVYAAGTTKQIIIGVSDAQKIVNRSDASVLANMVIKTPDTVAVPIIVNRLQAAGGLVNVGDKVDVYLNTNATNQTNVTSGPTPKISGATVLAILRARDSGTITANMTHAQDFAINQLVQSVSRSQSASKDVEQLLRAAASRNWDEGQVRELLNSYGWRLSDFERESNLGELDAQYLVLLEVPREDTLFVIQNMNSLYLTVPTQTAPVWMITELKAIYGT
jgi:hypothetical protein